MLYRASRHLQSEKHRLHVPVKLLPFLILAFSLSSTADTKRSYTVGVESFPYYPHYQTQGDSFEGYARDILDAFAQVKDFKLVYHPMPYMRILNLFLSNQLDLQYPDNQYWSEKQKKNHVIHYSEPAVNYTDGVHVTQENQGKPIEQLKSIGTLIGFSPVQYFPLEEKGLLEIHYSATVEGLIDQTHLGRIDGVYLNTDVIKFSQKNKTKKLTFDETLPHIHSGFSLSSIQYPEMIEEFNEFLKNNQPLVNKIKKKYQLR